MQCFQDRAAGTTKGCGFVYMSTRDEAQACINGMDGKTQIQVNAVLSVKFYCKLNYAGAQVLIFGHASAEQGSYAPLAVKWADPDLPNKKRKAVYDANADNRQARCFQSQLACWTHEISHRELRYILAADLLCEGAKDDLRGRAACGGGAHRARGGGRTVQIAWRRGRVQGVSPLMPGSEFSRGRNIADAETGQAQKPLQDL